LPPGYIVDKSSIKIANGALTYHADNGRRRLVFTLQDVPTNLDFADFYKAQMKDIHQYTTAYGQAIIGTNDNRRLGSLVSGTSWMLLSTNTSDVTFDDMSLVMSSLKKY
jgi:hypothetical protein